MLPPSAPACRACQGPFAHTFPATERMLGLGGEFTYGQCATCGSVSVGINDTPPDLDRFYPAQNYYSFTQGSQPAPDTVREKFRRTVRWLAGFRPLDTALIRRLCPDRSARILDVGSGAGEKLNALWKLGYTNLQGIDPYLPAEHERDAPFPLRRAHVSQVEAGWDLIMYHHVFEHVCDPAAELAQAAQKLRPGGRLLIRIPVADSWAFARYRHNWVQLDSPRHLCLFTRPALIALAAKHGLAKEHLSDDSTSFQIWASRIYENTAHSFLVGDNAYVRSGRGMVRWLPVLVFQTLFASWLNLRHRGDQTCAVFRRPQKEDAADLPRDRARPGCVMASQ